MQYPDRAPLDPVRDELTGVRFELLALQQQIADLLDAVYRLQPQITVEPAPVVFTPSEAPAPTLDLSPLLQALNSLSLRDDDAAEVEELKGLRKDISDLGTAMRAIAGSTGGTYGIGASVVNQGGDWQVINKPGTSLAVSMSGLGDSRGLTERMFAKAPVSGYTLYVDTADATYIYIAEAPTGGTTGARGVRVTKDASGNPLGAVATASGFDWNGRASATWSS